MKRANGIILTLALLMVAQLVSAQNGKISYGDLEMGYSYSSGKNMKVEWPEGWTASRFYEGHTTYVSPVQFSTITCEATPGEEITVTARKSKGTGNDRVGGCVLFDGQKQKGAEDAKGIKLTFKVPSENVAKKIKVQLWCGDPSNCVVLYEIIWKVKGSTTTTPPTTTPTPVEPERKLYTGTMERFGEKIKYTLYGGVVTAKQGPWTPPIDRILSPNSKAWGIIRVDVEPGEEVTLTLERLEGTDDSYNICEVYLGEKKTSKKNKATLSMKVSKTMESFDGKVVYYGKNSALEYNFFFTVKDRVSATAGSSNQIKWDDVVHDNNCEHCRGKYSDFKPNEYSGEYTCTKDPHKTEHDVVPGKVIYGDTKIKTEDRELGIDYGDQKDAIIIEKDSEVEFTNDNGVQMFNVIKGGIRGVNLHPLKGGKFLFISPQIEVIPHGTVFVIQSYGNSSRCYLLQGSVEVTSKKTNKKVTLNPGQASTVSANGEQKVQQFDIERAAKKFGITDAELQGQVTTAIAAKRYEMERAIVKYKVTKSNGQEGMLAKAFDMYGQYERRELQMGNHLTIALLQDNVSYTLDRNTKTAKRTKDADLNFLNLNETLMKKLNLKKKGTKKVLGKDCILYEGKDVQFYVWKGLVMKKVQKESDGTTTIHEVTSIEEPTSIEAKTFKMPSGYTIKNG